MGVGDVDGDAIAEIAASRINVGVFVVAVAAVIGVAFGLIAGFDSV